MFIQIEARSLRKLDQQNHFTLAFLALEGLILQVVNGSKCKQYLIITTAFRCMTIEFSFLVPRNSYLYLN